VRVWVLLVLAVVGVVGVVVSAADGGVVYVNVTNDTVFVRFGRLEVVNFTTTHVNIGWVNGTHLGCAYSCLYSVSPEADCNVVRVEVYDGTRLAYEHVFEPSSNNTDLCPPGLRGVCSGFAAFNVSGFQVVRVVVVDETQNVSVGPFEFTFPYSGPRLVGYASYIAVLVPYGVLIGLAGRLGAKNVGIGLVVYGLLAPVMMVWGVEISNIMLVSAVSIIMGAVLIWMLNE